MLERNTVVLVGSGRSGTTWLGSILDTYERADYYYEISKYPELSFDSPNLLQAKYPFSYWWKNSPVWVQEWEHKILLKLHERGKLNSIVDRSLRIRNRFRPKNSIKDVNLFKIVTPFKFALEYGDLLRKHNDRLKVVHIIRNPFAQLVSQKKMMFGKQEPPPHAFQNSIERIMVEARFSRYHSLAKECRNGSWAEKCAFLWWVGNQTLMDEPESLQVTVLFEDLALQTLEETERIFSFLGWQMPRETVHHINDTIDNNESENGQHSIRKDPSVVLGRWKKDIEEDDYLRVSRLLTDCPLMSLWTKEDLEL